MFPLPHISHFIVSWNLDSVCMSLLAADRAELNAQRRHYLCFCCTCVFVNVFYLYSDELLLLYCICIVIVSYLYCVHLYLRKLFIAECNNRNRILQTAGTLFVCLYTTVMSFLKTPFVNVFSHYISQIFFRDYK